MCPFMRSHERGSCGVVTPVTSRARSPVMVPVVRRMGVPSNIDRVRLTAILSVAAILLIQLVFFPMPLGNWIRGAIVGLLGAMLAMGMALIYRANRVINFAQADLGGAPTAFAAAF